MATAPKSTPAPSLVRNVMQSVTVARDGKPFTPTIGQPFEFTADEIKQIERMNPAAVSSMIVMDASDPAVAQVVSGSSSSAGESSL